MQGSEQFVIDLQQRLAAGQHDKSMVGSGAPFFFDGIGELPRRCILSAPRAVGADEVGIAELALR
jgi:hypothetical protein